MRKLIVSTLAVTAVLATIATANAGAWWNGVYWPDCFYGPYGIVCY